MLGLKYIFKFNNDVQFRIVESFFVNVYHCQFKRPRQIFWRTFKAYDSNSHRVMDMLMPNKERFDFILKSYKTYDDCKHHNENAKAELAKFINDTYDNVNTMKDIYCVD